MPKLKGFINPNIKIMLRRIISLVLTFGLLFQQAGFAQMAVDISKYFAASNIVSIDRLRPVHMRYFSLDPASGNFNLILDKGDSRNLAKPELDLQGKEVFKYFLIGLALPNESFWVNLRPDSPENMIDTYLAQTEVGKIFLEADLQLKKDTALLTSPQNPAGRQYWDKLYQKAGEIFGNDNITIPTLTRPWIVPGEVIVRHSKDSAYLYKATLKVMLEQDYLKDSAAYNFKDQRFKQLNEYSSELIRQIILPQLNKLVNNASRYARLRQVYYSLILAQWFKTNYSSDASTKYAKLIDSRNLTGLTSLDNWSSTEYFKQYQKSFQQGEYNIQEPHSGLTGATIRTYFSGGIKISSPVIAAMPVANNSFSAGFAPVLLGINNFAAYSPVTGTLPDLPQAKANTFSSPIKEGDEDIKNLKAKIKLLEGESPYDPKVTAQANKLRNDLREKMGDEDYYDNIEDDEEFSSPVTADEVLARLEKVDIVSPTLKELASKLKNPHISPTHNLYLLTSFVSQNKSKLNQQVVAWVYDLWYSHWSIKEVERNPIIRKLEEVVDDATEKYSNNDKWVACAAIYLIYLAASSPVKQEVESTPLEGIIEYSTPVTLPIDDKLRQGKTKIVINLKHGKQEKPLLSLSLNEYGEFITQVEDENLKPLQGLDSETYKNFQYTPVGATLTIFKYENRDPYNIHFQALGPSYFHNLPVSFVAKKVPASSPINEKALKQGVTNGLKNNKYFWDGELNAALNALIDGSRPSVTFQVSKDPKMASRKIAVAEKDNDKVVVKIPADNIEITVQMSAPNSTAKNTQQSSPAKVKIQNFRFQSNNNMVTNILQGDQNLTAIGKGNEIELSEAAKESIKQIANRRHSISIGDVYEELTGLGKLKTLDNDGYQPDVYFKYSLKNMGDNEYSIKGELFYYGRNRERELLGTAGADIFYGASSPVYKMREERKQIYDEDAFVMVDKEDAEIKMSISDVISYVLEELVRDPSELVTYTHPSVDFTSNDENEPSQYRLGHLPDKAVEVYLDYTCIENNRRYEFKGFILAESQGVNTEPDIIAELIYDIYPASTILSQDSINDFVEDIAENHSNYFKQTYQLNIKNASIKQTLKKFLKGQIAFFDAIDEQVKHISAAAPRSRLEGMLIDVYLVMFMRENGFGGKPVISERDKIFSAALEVIRNESKERKVFFHRYEKVEIGETWSPHNISFRRENSDLITVLDNNQETSRKMKIQSSPVEYERIAEDTAKKILEDVVLKFPPDKELLKNEILALLPEGVSATYKDIDYLNSGKKRISLTLGDVTAGIYFHYIYSKYSSEDKNFQMEVQGNVFLSKADTETLLASWTTGTNNNRKRSSSVTVEEAAGGINISKIYEEIQSQTETYDPISKDDGLGKAIVDAINNPGETKTFAVSVLLGELVYAQKDNKIYGWLAPNGEEEFAKEFSVKVSSPVNSLQSENPGGIDFRYISMVTQAELVPSKDLLKLPDIQVLKAINPDIEAAKLKQMMSAGIMPASERIMEFVSACYLKENPQTAMEKTVPCLVDFFRLQEQELVDTPEQLKAFLAFIDSSQIVM